MGKFFGQFLAESKLINADQLLHALVFQLKSAPSTAEVLFDHDLMNKDDQLKILAHQQINGTDYRSSAQALGLWSTDLAEKVSTVIQRARRPLGEVLVSLGYLDSDALGRSLDSYVEAMSGGKDRLLTNSDAGPVLTPDDSQQIAEPNSLDPTLCAEYAENLTTKIIPALNALVAHPRFNNKDELDQFLRKALSEISAIRAAATFVSASKSLLLATEMSATLSILRKASSAPPQAELIEMLKYATHVFDGLGQLIGNFYSEKDFTSDVNLNDLYERVVALQSRLRARTVGNTVA